MQMDILRCKTPELVRKEIWTHLLAYNLIRTIIAQAAIKHSIDPRSISFKGAIQTLEAFQPVIAMQGHHDSAFRTKLYRQLLDAIAAHRVADRPDRFEPRRVKRRPKRYDRLMKPRHEAKRDILNALARTKCHSWRTPTHLGHSRLEPAVRRTDAPQPLKRRAPHKQKHREMLPTGAGRPEHMVTAGLAAGRSRWDGHHRQHE